MKITVVAREIRDAYTGEISEYMKLTPTKSRNRSQSICNTGIFNLMGIRKPGRYTINCKEVRRRNMGCCKDAHVEHDNENVRQILSWMEEFVHTKRGKEWLAEVAAKVGVPLQIALPLKEKDDRSG